MQERSSQSYNGTSTWAEEFSPLPRFRSTVPGPRIGRRTPWGTARSAVPGPVWSHPSAEEAS